MRKLRILILGLFCFTTAFSQKKLTNPKIGKNETEMSLFLLRDNRKSIMANGRHALGGQISYRLAWKKSTKPGIGILIAADYNSRDKINSDVFLYGVVFADITQFIGSRQKWSIGAQAGPGLYTREYKNEDATSKGFIKYSGGMYYSFSVSYRAIVSEKTLLFVSPFYSIRNFRRHTVTEFNSPQSIQETKVTESHSGLGLKLGVVF